MGERGAGTERAADAFERRLRAAVVELVMRGEVDAIVRWRAQELGWAPPAREAALEPARAEEAIARTLARLARTAPREGRAAPA